MFEIDLDEKKVSSKCTFKFSNVVFRNQNQEKNKDKVISTYILIQPVFDHLKLRMCV